MSYGIQTFVKGTTFDAVNSIDFNYVVDIFTASGAGSKVIPVALTNGLTLSAQILVQYFPGNNSTYNLSVSGNTVSWNFSGSATICVIGNY